ncbi:MAG: phosphotransferase [Gammaproteobacteria bacterium]|nr:phosphotransferase [Gammaproteobacteria bacterium]MDH5345526.1 phosphotransferase [Gammaproteobacteria bacterium]
MTESDPLAVIAAEPPAFSDADAIAIVQEHWGLVAAVKSLVSERDQNFRVRTDDGRECVLKIANAAEDPLVTDFQVRALVHIASRVRAAGIPIRTPVVLPASGGELSVVIRGDGGCHVTRLVTFLPGVPLADREPSARLARRMGAYLAHLGRALHGFSHPGSHQSLLWDLQQAPRLRELIRYVRDPATATAVSAVLDEFEQLAMPVLPTLRSQVVHSDMNPDNVLVSADDPDTVAGVIDFGDMLYAPLIADVAIGCSYVRVSGGDPLALIAEFVAGYHDVMPLERAELDILFELIQARLCASITIIDRRSALKEGDDPYLDKLMTGEGSAHRFLARLREVPRERARRAFIQVCASAGQP